MTTFMWHTEAVCLYLCIQHGSRSKVTFRCSLKPNLYSHHSCVIYLPTQGLYEGGKHDKWKKNVFPTNTKLNAKSWSIPLRKTRSVKIFSIWLYSSGLFWTPLSIIWMKKQWYIFRNIILCLPHKLIDVWNDMRVRT